MSAPKLRDVAKRAGVHPSTASRALNPETRFLVNAVTLQRVDDAAMSLGYQANAIARSLRTRKTSTIGMLIPDLTNPVFPPTVRGVEDGLAGSGYNVLLANTDNDLPREVRHFEALKSRQVDGLIVATATLDSPLAAETTVAPPMVLLYNMVQGLDAPAVGIDNAMGTRLSVEHLRRLGHDRIAYIAGPQDRSPGVDRLRAFRAEMGRSYDKKIVHMCPSFSEEQGAKAFRTLLDSGQDFTAVLTASDLLAIGVYDVMTEREISCPDDYSVMGFHDVALMDKLRPGLTTVHVPHHQVGVTASELLLNLLKGGSHPSEQISVPVELVERGSTAPPGSRSEVRRAR